MATVDLHYNTVTGVVTGWIGGVYTQIGPIFGEASVTTTGNIDNLDFSNASVLRMNNATDATIRGLVAGCAGQRLIIVSLGAGAVYLAHQDTNSTAANRLINFVTSGNTPLAAGVGIAILEYDATTLRWRLISHTQGNVIAWTPTLTAGTPGDLSVSYTSRVANYMVVGRAVSISYYIETSAFTWTTASGRYRVTGIPLINHGTYYGSGPLAIGDLVKAGYTSYATIIDPGASIINGFASGTGVGSQFIQITDLTSGGTVVLNGTLAYTTT